ncbi:MAG: beta-glucanase (GH16 family) [Colwellia sp.]|jgi:beta-glucanase (GH16 family)
MNQCSAYQRNVNSMLKNICFKSRLFLMSLLSLLITTPTMAGWEVSYIDTFSGDSVNWQNWTAQIDANFNNEVQCYTDDDSSINKNFDVSDGTLKIIARKQQTNCAGLNNQSRDWTSGRINGKDKREFLYGRIESRIRFHNLEGGTWPAFWMLENRIAESPRKNDDDFINWPNPGAGEIDVWEWFANSPSTYITNFFNTGGGSCGNEVRFAYPNGANDVLDWHDYAIEWDENNISFYMDDTLVTSHNVSNCPQYKEPMFVLLNVAMGGNLGGTIDSSLSKVTMEVDYLAHCTSTNQNSATRCNESTPAVYADDDNDGIENNIDNCPNTPPGEIVDENGCVDEVVNLAPEVSLVMTQANVIVSSIDITGGLVEISANATDENTDDILSYIWFIPGAIPSPIINGGIVSFDPSSMSGGSSHQVNLTVNDSGDPILSVSSSIQFTVNESQIVVIDDKSTSSSGGSFSYVMLLLFILLRSKNGHSRLR